MKDNIDKVISKMGLRIESKFIPFSQSRNKNEKSPSLNWIVTLYQNDKEVLSTEYMAGCGHCPSYNNKEEKGWDKQQLINFECENGFKAKRAWSLVYIASDKKEPILPDTKNVIYSLVMDSDAIDYDFSDWASNYGYETDSRKAEKIYNECLEIGLRMLRVLGKNNINLLREVYQDY